MALPFPAFASDQTISGSVEAVGSSPSQITVLSNVSGDDNRNGLVKVEYSEDGAWGNPDDRTACESLTGGSPRVCYISWLKSDTTYQVKVTFIDPDGVTGIVSYEASARTRPVQEDKYPPTLSIIKPMEKGVVGGNSRYPVTIDFTVYDRHSGISSSSGDVPRPSIMFP